MFSMPTGHMHHYRPGFIQIQGEPALYELDFYVQGLSPAALFWRGVILEIDGMQHFKESWFGHEARSLEANRRSDVRKMEMVLEQGYSIVRHMARPIRCGDTQWEALAPVLERAGTTPDGEVIMLQDCPEYRAMAVESLTHLAHKIRYY